MSGGGRQTRSPLALRLVHAVVFLGFATSAVAAVYPELLHLVAALGARFHPGTPPSPLALSVAALAAGGAALLLANVVRRRSTPLPVSALLLAAFLGALVFRQAEPPALRTWQGADVAILETARALQLEMVGRLQRQAGVPKESGAWNEALAKLGRDRATGGASPVRSRLFAPLPYTLRRVAGQGSVPEGVDPATLLLWMSEDQVSFELTPIGLDSHGQAGPLRDGQGDRIVLKAVFNPDLARPGAGG